MLDRCLMRLSATAVRLALLGGLATFAAVSVLGGALAQQPGWPTKAGERWELIGPFALDAAKGTHAIDLSRMKGTVRAIRLGTREQGLEMSAVRIIYMSGAATEERRRINLLARERTRTLGATGDERFIDQIELAYGPNAKATGPTLLEVWLLRSERGANAERPPPKVAPAPVQRVAAAPAPKVDTPPVQAKPSPPAQAKPAPAPPAAPPVAKAPDPGSPAGRLLAAVKEAWSTSPPDWQARMVQDATMEACTAHKNAPPKAISTEIQAREKARIVYPADGNFVGDWKKGEAIAQSGYGLRFTDKDTKRANGGNCYACHQLSPKELSYGTLGPPLREYGKQRKYAPAEAKALYERIYNAQAVLACSNMPRLGVNGVLTIEQIQHVVALLMDPESPVNK